MVWSEEKKAIKNINSSHISLNNCPQHLKGKPIYPTTSGPLCGSRILPAIGTERKFLLKKKLNSVTLVRE
jgi:hypothetical protein